jgi:hypothetical protein
MRPAPETARHSINQLRLKWNAGTEEIVFMIFSGYPVLANFIALFQLRAIQHLFSIKNAILQEDRMSEGNRESCKLKSGVPFRLRIKAPPLADRRTNVPQVCN